MAATTRFPTGGFRSRSSSVSISEQQQETVLVDDHGAKGDASRVTDGAMTSGSSVLHTGAAVKFGQRVEVIGAGAAGVNIAGWAAHSPTAGQINLVTTQFGSTPLTASTTVSAAPVTYGTLDSAAFQAAINACSARGGGLVSFRPGRAYLITGVVLASNVTISGAAANKTTIYIDPSSMSTGLQAFQYAPSAGFGTPGAHNVTIQDLRFPGHGSERQNQTPVVIKEMVDVTIQRCEVTNLAGASAFFLGDSTRAHVRDNYILNVGTPTLGNNIFLVSQQAGSTTPMTDFVVEGNTVIGAGTEAIAFVATSSDTSTTPYYGRISHNYVDSTTSINPSGPPGIYCETGTSTQSKQQLIITNNEVVTPGSCILVLNDSVTRSPSPLSNAYCVIANNLCTIPGGGTAPIGIGYSGSYATITGNVISAASTVTSGINITTPGGAISVTGNATNGSPTVTGVAGAAGVLRGWQVGTTGFLPGTYVNDGIGTTTWTMSANWTGSTGAVTLSMLTPAYGVMCANNVMYMPVNFTTSGIGLAGVQKSVVANNHIYVDVGSTSGVGAGIKAASCGWVDIKDNRIDHVPTHGILLQNSNDLTVTRNVIHNPSDINAGFDGIHCVTALGGTDNSFSFNKIVDDRPTPLMLHAISQLGSNVTILDNVMLGQTSNPVNGLSGVARLLGNQTSTQNWLPIAAISVTASPFVFTNTQAYPQVVTVGAGTVSAIAISRDAGSTFNATGMTAGAFQLMPADEIQVTYTGAPTMTRIPVW